MSLFPFATTEDLTLADQEVTASSIREYEIDFEKGTLTGRIVTGVDALCVWAYLALKAKRYRWIIYSWGYGDEVYDLIGYSYSEEYLNSEVRRYMEECLFENEHITGVQDLEVSQIKDVLHIKFTLVVRRWKWMYEDQTYENILDRSLARVASDVDKREGSVIMNAIAPVSAEHADVYIQLGNIVNNGYADTAVREFLILRCKERGIIPYEATKATLKGKFNMEIPIGSRFNLNELNYVATAFIESADGYFYYQMECETEGTNGNKFFGELSPIEYIDKDLTGELTELLIPAEDEEDTEALRTRYLNSFDSNPFGGNKQDYVEKTDALDGVGGTVVIPVWNGGGTVKLIIINSDFGVASSTLVKAVQEAIDPDPQGTGSGIAPIGHTVTVVSAVGKTVSIKSRITLNDGYRWSQVKPKAEETLEAYFLEMRKNWEKGNLVVRISQIENRLLNLDGILDVADTQLNDVASNLALAQEEIPLLGGVYIG